MNKLENTAPSQPDTVKQKNSNLSLLLILINALLLLVYLNSGYVSENQIMENILWLLVGFMILFAGYAFGYSGKQYRWAKWLFVLLLIGCILYGGMLLYANALGKAFIH